MKRYVLNTLKNSDGEYEVHESSCSLLPSYVHQKDLGYHFSCTAALRFAKGSHSEVNGCYQCNKVCHTAEVEV